MDRRCLLYWCNGASHAGYATTGASVSSSMIPFRPFQTDSGRGQRLNNSASQPEPLDMESGMLRFTPVERSTGERLHFEIPYRAFPRTLEYHGVIIHPETKVRYRVLGKECSVPGCACDAWVERIDDAATPGFYPNPEHDWWSLDIEYPDDVQRLIDDYEQEFPDDASIFFIHGKLWTTRRESLTRVEMQMDLRSELYPAIQEAERGEGIPANEAFEAIRRELPARMAELDRIDKGNLAIPEKLYAFALEQVDSGTFPSATDFVVAAIRSPVTAATRTLSGRWDHVIRDKELRRSQT